MRLLALTNHYPPNTLGSYELQCYQVCRELLHRGHQVHVLAGRPRQEADQIAVQKNVFRELQLYDEQSAKQRPFRQLFGMVRKNRKILERHLNTFLPEAILVWGMDRLPTSLLELIESSGIPVLYGVYDFWLASACQSDLWGSYWEENEGVVDAAVMRPLLRMLGLQKLVIKQAALGKISTLKLKHLYFCSESLKQETIKACGLPLADAKVVPCGISQTEIRPRRGQQTWQTCRLIYLARLNEDKDPLTAIRAIQELRRRGDERFTLDIYGWGSSEYESALHDYVRRFQLGGSISFKSIAEEQVRNTIHLYDALIFTSRYPEPFPLVHLKAMAARVPVISTLNGGCAELIRHGENGLSFETANPHDLANKLVEIADNPEAAERMADAAHAEVIHNYTIGRVTSRIESLLHRAVEDEVLLEEVS